MIKRIKEVVEFYNIFSIQNNNYYYLIQEYKDQFKAVKDKHDLQIDDFNELFSFVTSGNFKIKNVTKRISKLKKLPVKG